MAASLFDQDLSVVSRLDNDEMVIRGEIVNLGIMMITMTGRDLEIKRKRRKLIVGVS